MKHNIIQMTAAAGLTVPHSMNPIFQYISIVWATIPWMATSISCKTKKTPLSNQYTTRGTAFRL